RAVTAEAEDQVGRARRLVAGDLGEPERGRFRRRHPGVVAGIPQPADDLDGEPLGVLALVVADDDDADHGRAPGARAWTSSSRLPSAPVIGESVQPSTAQPASTSAASISPRTRAWIAGSVT